MEIRHLRYFLAVAEHGSVAEAARKLNIVQPALSRQIHDLEEQLGTQLFQRSIRGTQLTVAGVQFMKDCSKLLIDLEDAKKRALRAASGKLGSLRIGISPNHTAHPELLKRLRRFREICPDVALMLEPALSPRQLLDVKEERMDGGFIAFRDLADKQLSGIKVLRSGLMLAVSSDHKYAEQPPDRLSEMKDEPCVWFPRDRAPEYHDYLIQQCMAAGLTPKQILVGTDVGTTLGMVAAGMGYSIVSEASKYNSPNGVVLHQHADIPDIHDVEFIFLSENDSPILRAFAEVMNDGGSDSQS
ncbi:LysR family transcriptional regulator [Herbaspirillum lusitanum]|uniref:LysR family transcriptional regulator n=1 Tax=Herbaspirillum lusitanum TaxID=213312 RepID=UPI00037A7705|nr:LysR family transcriptional regulator [Herbaspirillum lusitanum]